MKMLNKDENKMLKIAHTRIQHT